MGKIGSSFDAFLAEERILEACEEQALKQILTDQITAAEEYGGHAAYAAAGSGRRGEAAPVGIGVTDEEG